VPSTREIRRRIRSVKSTEQITRAMEMVAASKMRRAQAQALAGRPYADKMLELVTHLAWQPLADGQETLHPLLQARPVKSVAAVLVTSDRGLAGGYNSHIIQRAAAFILQQTAPVGLMTVGRKGRDWMVRRGQRVLADFSGMSDRPTILDVAPIASYVTDGFIQGEFDEVHIFYTEFISSMRQEPRQRLLLPLQRAQEEQASPKVPEYIYEPSAPDVLAALLPRFVETEIYQSTLEALASEQSARMLAMHNASQSASDIERDLTLRYNKARQTGITTELLEISAGAEVLSHG